MSQDRPRHDARPPVRAVLIDVDGTLVDSNDLHAQAWIRAFAAHGFSVNAGEVRRAIGMGGDKLMPRVSGIEEESELGRDIAERRGEIFSNELLSFVKPLPGAGELIRALRARGLTLVAASSAKEEELEKLLAIAGVREVLGSRTSSDDADQSKPAPDIVHVALARAGVGPDEALMIGDTPYDIEAATRAGVRTIAFRSGGWADGELQGAIAIYDGPWDLLQRLDSSPLCVVNPGS
jgi:beta-phosphoglucomutase-like phosphatase (HAD superfamily)